MPHIKVDHIISFSSEDPAFVASNILSSDLSKKWKCQTVGEKTAVVVLQLEKATVISGIDIGNEHSAYIEVLVSRSGTSDDYKVLLVTSAFMTPLESRQSHNVNKVRMFTKDDLCKPECDEKWDRVKIVCTQPFNKHVQYGLSFVIFHTKGEKPTGSAIQTNIGKFAIRPESPDNLTTGSLFAKRKEFKQEEKLTAAAAIREATTTTSLARYGSPQCKPRLKTGGSTPTATPKKVKHSNGDDVQPQKDRNRNELFYSKEDDEPNEKIDRIIKRNEEGKEKQKAEVENKDTEKRKEKKLCGKDDDRTRQKGKDVVKAETPGKGDFGKYQAWQFCLHILSAVTAGLNMMTLVTVAAVPEHRCEIPGYDLNKTYTSLNESMLAKYLPKLESGKFDTCSLFNSTTNSTYRCESFVFDRTYYESSRAIEWEFICDRRWMGAVAQSTYMFGVFTGAVVLGNMADKVGRKPVFCWSAVLQLILGVAVAFTPEYFSFLVIRFLYGIVGSAGCYIPGFVLTMELVGPSKRSMCGVAFQGAFAFGIMLVAGWGAVIKDRQLLQIIYGCHALLLVGHFWLMDESPRWLWNNGRAKEAVDIIKKALKTNGNPINVDSSQFVSKGVSEMRTKDESAGILDLFRTPNLRKKTLNVMLCWFANAIVYYGLSLNTGSLQGNPFLILFVMGLIEIPSYFITVYLMDRLGRRSLTSFEMILGGICCIIAVSIVQGPVSTSFVFAGKFLIASSFAIIYNYSAELFPTVIRSFAMGLGAMCARTSGALTPFITLLDSFDPKMPSIIFAVISIVSGLLVMFLPETLNKPMPETIEEGEKFGVGDTFFTAVCGNKDDEESLNKKAESEQLQPLKNGR